MATAIYVSTESGDDYLYCLETTASTQTVGDYLREQLGEEYEYISTMLVTHSD